MDWLDRANELIDRGGPVMWALLGLSVLALTLTLERAWFYLRANVLPRQYHVPELIARLQRGDREGALRLSETDNSPYGRFVQALLQTPSLNEAAANQIVEQHRRPLDRFLPTLATIITASPMLGILGTVLGIIRSFDLLAAQAGSTDPAAVSQGIAEALITTAVGLIIAIVALFPYNAFRVQLERTLARFEILANAALHERTRTDAPSAGDTSAASSEASPVERPLN